MPPPVALAPLGGGLFLGWTLGANNAANCFGTAVATRIVSWRRASVICSVMVVLGAVAQGSAGIKTLSGLADQTVATALVVSVAAALTGAAMTHMRLPISTSQAVVGAILGIGLAAGRAHYGVLTKVVVCWIATPIGSMIVACVVYKLLALFLRRVPMSLFTRDKILWAGLLVVGAYGAYALGANNVTNSTGIFSGLIPGVGDRMLALVGGLAIALGVMTYSKRVMERVGADIVSLDAFTALVALLGMAVTMHVFAVVGVPVSSSQAIVGAIVGIGLLRGARGIRFKALRDIGIGWLLTPVMSLILSAAGYAIFCGGGK